MKWIAWLAVPFLAAGCDSATGPGCANGQSACGDGAAVYCADLQMDNADCGECGHHCEPGYTCNNSACVPECGVGKTLCGVGALAHCVDLQQDFENCGSCANSCLAGQACVLGVCSREGPAATLKLRFTEGFASAFRVRNAATTVLAPASVQNQDLPGVVFQTETGFFNSALVGHPARGVLATAGLAEQGTRLIATFNGVPAGARLFVSVRETGASPSLVAQLVGVSTAGAGIYAPVVAYQSCATSGLSEIEVAAGTAVAVWEVILADALAVQHVEFDAYLAYSADGAMSLPAVGDATVGGSLGPTSAAAPASSTDPVPRFAAGGTPTAAFSITTCASSD